MFLSFLIIYFSWVSFALAAILYAYGSSPAAEPLEPIWSVECTQGLAIQVCTHHRLNYICTITALVFFCYYQHVLSQLLLKHQLLPTKSWLLFSSET